jgi:two-component system, cell cycle response regulator
VNEAKVTNEAKSSAGAGSALDSVLIAEDDPIFRRVLQSWFKKWGYQVTAAGNGLEAWNALQIDGAPQLAVLDWMMPEMDGLELCRRIRGQSDGPYRYVLLLTAKDDRQDVVAGLDAGADDYLTKPFDADELRARVRAGKRILELQRALLQARDKLQFEATHDPLTGLFNRGAILSFLQRELDRQSRNNFPLGVLMADLDHFKRVNDTYGHLVGDGVLQEVARRLTNTVRSYDLVGRYGGEEFLLILPGCSQSDLLASAERLRHNVADLSVETSAGSIAMTLSLGCASSEIKEDGPESCKTLLQAADAALYAAKAAGRNRAVMAPAAQAAVSCG